MAADEVLLDDKAKRMRDLLSSFYAPDPSTASNNASKYVSLDAINTPSFDADQYMNLLVCAILWLPCFFRSVPEAVVGMKSWS